MLRNLLMAGALGVAVLAPQEAAAQLIEGGPSCSVFNSFIASTGPVNYLACGGAFVGNDTKQDVEGWVSSNWGLDVDLIGKTDDPGNLGPFVGFGDDDGSSWGELFFTYAVSGEFVLSLKAGDYFSLYHFDTGAESWMSLEYKTDGVALNKNGQPQDLSHASFYAGSSTVTVPEPASMILLLSGLAGLGIVARRRNTDEV